MNHVMETLTVNRKTILSEIVQLYVKEGLAKGDFYAIPYHEDIKLRDPLSPGGATASLKNKNQAYEAWWQMLPELVEKWELVDTTVHEDEVTVTLEFCCYVREPRIKLRIKDRFMVDDEGIIFFQENLVHGTTPNFESNIF
jgi:hypothetical protein